MTYQHNFSKINQSVLNKRIRRIKARKIFLIIKDFAKKRNIKLKKTNILDIGGSAGFAAKELAKHANKVYVVDIDKKALLFGKKENNLVNVIYKFGDAMNLPFKSKKFDIIICNQVYEHVSNSNKLVKEIARVLKDNGFVYFGAGNKLMLVEKHYNLPFLSWLPKKIANLYLKLTRGKEVYYENLLSYKGLKKLLKDFTVIDYSIKIVKNSEKFYALDIIKKNNITSRLPCFILTILIPFFPGYVFILIKK